MLFKVTIKNRWTAAVQFEREIEAESETLAKRTAVVTAAKEGADGYIFVPVVSLPEIMTALEVRRFSDLDNSLLRVDRERHLATDTQWAIAIGHPNLERWFRPDSRLPYCPVLDLAA